MIELSTDRISEPHRFARLSVQDFDAYLRESQKTVAMLAHYYWLLRGCPEGSPDVDWHRAQEKIDQVLLEQLQLGAPA